MLECVVKGTWPTYVKGIILGISAVTLGALGVVGGKRTIQGIKLWFQSLINKS